MKQKKREKRRILKVRPFNMANFSGGSGYLVFSLIYQAFAILPASLIIWFLTLVKLPKNEDGSKDLYKAGKRFYAVAIPFSIVLIIIATVLAFSFNYGTFLEYWFEVIFISLVPSLCTFFILRHFHKKVVLGESTLASILISLVLIIIVLVLAFAFSVAVDSIVSYS